MIGLWVLFSIIVIGEVILAVRADRFDVSFWGIVCGYAVFCVGIIIVRVRDTPRSPTR
jgi:ABC-type spermidine/putrescine transport system permease subunit II